ncbi:MAG: hypothetical protein R2747_19750 [Pyrinomonadaceae bacterium]
MKETEGKPKTEKKSVEFGGINAEASLWVLLPKVLASLFFSSVMILLRFWQMFGYLSAFAFGFVIFTSALQVLIIVGLRFQNRTDLAVDQPERFNWLDWIGAWWLMACAGGAFFGWLCGNLAVAFPAWDLTFQLAKVFLTIVLPILTMLPNTRYVSAKTAYIQIPLLIVVTTLPMLVGIGSVWTLWTRFFSGGWQ